jgi:hypothetical protein
LPAPTLIASLRNRPLELLTSRQTYMHSLALSGTSKAGAAAVDSWARLLHLMSLSISIFRTFVCWASHPSARCAHGLSLPEFARYSSREPRGKSVGQIPSPKLFSWFFLLVPNEFWYAPCSQGPDGSWGEQSQGAKPRPPSVSLFQGAGARD